MAYTMPLSTGSTHGSSAMTLMQREGKSSLVPVAGAWLSGPWNCPHPKSVFCWGLSRPLT